MSPKLKESRGTVEFRGACIAELQRLVFFECASAQQWNRDKITQSFAGPGSWEFTGPGVGDSTEEQVGQAESTLEQADAAWIDLAEKVDLTRLTTLL